MNLYLSAETTQNIGYTPDWIKATYEEKGQEFELTLDVRGEIDYNPNTLKCRCKGELIPWVLWNCEESSEIDLSELDEAEVNKMFPLKKIIKILKKATYFSLGIWLADATNDNIELAQKDKFSDPYGEVYIFDGKKEHRIRMKFNEVEINE